MESENNCKDFIDIVRFTKCLSLNSEKAMSNLTEEFFTLFKLALCYYSENERQYVENKNKLLSQLWKLIATIEINSLEDAKSLLVKSKKILESISLI